MIHHLKGDLLKSDCTIIAHQSNTKSNMGAGIAKQIKKIYPEAFEADKKFRLPPRERMGKFSFTLANNKKRLIFNLYGQFNPGKAKSNEELTERYKALESAFELMLQAVKRAEEKGYPVKVGIPCYMGAGLAGGNWQVIYAFIERLSEEYNRDIYIYEL